MSFGNLGPLLVGGGGEVVDSVRNGGSVLGPDVSGVASSK